MFWLIFYFFFQTSILDNSYFLIVRYVLKKRFGRGSYGEVWLAFHWNCHEVDNSSSWSDLTKNVSGESICEDMYIRNPCNISSTDDLRHGSFHDSLFILKRIMVSYLIVSFFFFFSKPLIYIFFFFFKLKWVCVEEFIIISNSSFSLPLLDIIGIWFKFFLRNITFFVRKFSKWRGKRERKRLKKEYL